MDEKEEITIPEVNMNFFKSCLYGIVFLNPFLLFSQQNTHIINRDIKSSILDESRTVTIYLPDKYSEKNSGYPLLIVLDGEDFSQLASATSNYYANTGRMPHLIVVGIMSGDRWKDYTPTHANIPDGTPLPTSGGGKNFCRFITDELIPELKRNYPISPFIVIFGHSIAGLEACDCLLNSPVFSAAIATSPSLWWDKEYLRVNIADSFSKSTQMKYLYFTMGNEGSTMMDPAKRFLADLKKHGEADLNWKFRNFEDVDHQIAPFKELPYALEFIFDDWQMPSSVMEKGLSDVEDYYSSLSKKYRQKVKVPESVYNQLGYNYLRKGDIDSAISVFKLNIASYPESSNVYDSMGDAYMKSGNRALAMKNFEKSLKIDPGNTHAERMLKEIGTEK